MIEIKRTEDDDSEFVTLVSRLISGVVLRHDAEKLYLVHIKNWFDHKWLEFSGKVLGALGVWQRRMTYPPFNPNRVFFGAASRQEGGERHISRVFTPTPSRMAAEFLQPLQPDPERSHRLCLVQ